MDQKFWPEIIGRIAGLQWASGAGMWALASILPRSAKQRETARLAKLERLTSQGVGL
jgi:hypothetical protein